MMGKESPEQRDYRVYREQFSARLKKALAAIPLSQNMLAKRLRAYSQPTINRVVSSKRMPEAYLVVLIAQEINCNAEWLLTGEGEPGLD